MTYKERKYYLMNLLVRLVPGFIKKKYPVLTQKKVADIKYLGILEKANIEGFTLLELMLTAVIIGLLYMLSIGMYYQYFKSAAEMAAELQGNLQDNIDRGTSTNTVYINDPGGRHCFHFELDDNNRQYRLVILSCDVVKKIQQSAKRSSIAERVRKNIKYVKDKISGKCQIESGYGEAITLFVPCDSISDQLLNQELGLDEETK